MSEQDQDPLSIEGNDLSAKQEIIDLLRDLEVHGVDFSEEDLPHLSAMEEDELIQYFIVALMEAGVENPEEVLASHNLIEGFRKYNQDEIAARSSRTLKGVGYRVDELDEETRRKRAGNT